MIYLVGIGHSFQICAFKPFSMGGLENYVNRQLALDFEIYLRDLVARLTPQIVCEEYSLEQLLQKQKIDEKAYSVAQKVCALSEGVMHMFIDPDRKERDSLYPTPDSEAEDERSGFPIRECEWLRRISPRLEARPVLIFICGAHHINSISDRFKAIGHDVSVSCADFQFFVEKK